MNNILQYLVYLIVGVLSISALLLIMLVLGLITRTIYQSLINFNLFKNFNYWPYNNHIISNILYYIAIIIGSLILIISFIVSFIELGQMVLG